MKSLKFIIPMAAFLLAGTTLNSQTMYNADQMMGSDLNGTARFVGMGGAMGALGGDISTMGTNPAGIGLFRSSDVSASFGFSNVGTKSVFQNYNMKNDEFFGSFDNVGFVIALKQSNTAPLRFINFGFSYQKVKSFDRNTIARGDYDVSQTDQFAYISDGKSPGDLLASDAFDNRNIPWLGALAYEAYLIQSLGNNEYAPYWRNGDVVLGDYNSQERGAIHSYNFNLAFNLYDRFYLGATVGAYDVDYRKTSQYSEVFEVDGADDGNYLLENHYSQSGTGFDFKLGMIFRPIETSPLRIGLAIHTPTFYRLTSYNRAYLDYDVYDVNSDQRKNGTAVTVNPQGYEWDGRTEYKVVTPWKFNASLGYTIGTSIALGAEYEYTNNSSAILKYYDGLKMERENAFIDRYLKGVNTIRLGAEFKVAPEFAFRLGYNHSSASARNDAFKEIPDNSIMTDTEFSNSKAVNNYTLGLGYRGRSFYADMAYKYNTYKQDFYAFEDQNLPATEITNDRHQVLFTLGMRF